MAAVSNHGRPRRGEERNGVRRHGCIREHKRALESRLAAIRLLAVLSILPIAAIHCSSFNLASILRLQGDTGGNSLIIWLFD